MNEQRMRPIQRGDIYYADLAPVIGSEQGGVRQRGIYGALFESADPFTVEYANEMALCLQRLKKDGEIMKYCAALEVEEPSTFTEALDMAIDIDDYELISDSEREYGRQALRRMGANDEVLEAIEGHTDFDRLGSEMMEEDGVRQTGFGLVRRLSKPFPPAQEPDQQMGGLSC